MHKTYHAELCKQALENLFSTQALNIIISANLAQDGLYGQLGHPEYHFDDNAFEAGYAYMQEQRKFIWEKIRGPGEVSPTWKAFGRLTHAAQDFYAHSNYISLWLDSYYKKDLPPPDQINPLDTNILNHPDLCSGKIFFWDWLAFIPGLEGLAKRILPSNSHTHMNLDSPNQGTLFFYAFHAAKKRTLLELERIKDKLNAADLQKFLDS